MSLAVVHSRALAGMDAPPVTVEAHLANGLPSFTIVGLPEAEVKEAKDRVRAALQNARFEFPMRRITVNLAPADLPKESGRFDLPIALGILAASDQLPASKLADCEFAGELALTGELRPVRGALAMALSAARSRRAFILPEPNAREAALVEEATVYPARCLLDVCAHLMGRAPLERCQGRPARNGRHHPDLQDVKGQSHARRVLEIAAAGGHSLVMVGPPGTGKSMLAARLPGILPPMTRTEALAAAAMQSLGSGGFDLANWSVRPFRAPHHTASAIALVGGGSYPRPGEISMALHGVLFLDELPEFDRKVLEVLREPLESGSIVIARARDKVRFPARFQLVAAMNPCPCGYLGDPGGHCRCTPEQIQRYRNKLSGPLLDRIDLHLTVARESTSLGAGPDQRHASARVAAQVAEARERQQRRQGCANAFLDLAGLRRHCALEAADERWLEQAAERLRLSLRATHRLLKVARTLADLEGTERIARPHLAEALQYRPAGDT